MRRMIVAGVAAGLVASIPGCSSGEQPRPKFSAPSETVEPSVRASSPPSPDLRAATPVSAVRLWIDGLNALTSTGDDSQIQQVSAKSCTSCDGYIEPFRSVYESGGFIKSNGWKIANRTPLRADESQDSATVDIAIRETSGRSKATRTADTVQFDEKKFIVRFETVKSSRGKWRVSALTTVS